MQIKINILTYIDGSGGNPISWKSKSSANESTKMVIGVLKHIDQLNKRKKKGGKTPHRKPLTMDIDNLKGIIITPTPGRYKDALLKNLSQVGWNVAAD